MTRLGSVVLGVALVTATGCADSTESGLDRPERSAGAIELTAEPATVARRVDERFQSYNVEMVEVTGGNFWAPYDAATSENQVYRPPIDLEDARLRNLARALSPAYVRVSGTAANSTFFDLDGSTDGEPPEGFSTVLTPDQWDGVGDFADDVNADLVTSFAVSTGTRDDDGAWLPDQAEALLAYSRDNDVEIAAAEFFNEPSLNLGTTDGYDAAGFSRDFEVFESVVAETLPSMAIVGPGAVEDVTPLLGTPPPIAADDMLAAVSPAFDAFSYHFYPQMSERCTDAAAPEDGLTSEFLSRVDVESAFYEELRDTHEPDAPMWITETAEAACGGDRWAKQFVDVFRYLDQLGRLARGDTSVVMHNTLASSDYGLVDEETLEPRPNYWAAVLWQRLMGDQVLAVDIADGDDELAVYAHCTEGAADGSVAFVVLNLSQTDDKRIALPEGESDLFALSSDALESEAVDLNGERLAVSDDGVVGELASEAVSGEISVAPTTANFVVVDGAAPQACDGG